MNAKRVLLKMSGEALAGDQESGISPQVMTRVADEIRAAHREGIGIGIVTGGGNIFRGRLARECNLVEYTAHFMGMLATVMNGLALQGALERAEDGQGGEAETSTRLMTAIEMREVAEPFIQRRALRHLDKGRIVIFAAGTGNPFFTTDTGAALRAVQMKADVILKGTNVDGVYSGDPNDSTVTELVRFEELSFDDVLSRDLRVMDATAASMAKEHNIPVVVFDMTKPGNLTKALLGQLQPHERTIVS